MIAPDPALAGPRPAARPDPANAGQARTHGNRRRDEDFESTLTTPTERRPEHRREAHSAGSPQGPAETSADPANAAAPRTHGRRRHGSDLEATLTIPTDRQPERYSEREAAESPQAPAAMAANPMLRQVDATTGASAVTAAAKTAVSAPTPSPEDPIGSTAPVDPAIRTQPVLVDTSTATVAGSDARKDVPVGRVGETFREPRAGTPTSSAGAVPAIPKSAGAPRAPIETRVPDSQPRSRDSAAHEPRDGDRSVPTPIASATPTPVAQPAAVPGSVQTHGVVSSDAPLPQWHLAPDPATGAVRADAPAPTPTAVTPQAVIGQLALAVGQTNDRRVELRLDPPELGRVQIHLKPVDGGVQAVVLADRPETQDLLRRHADQLTRELGDAGYGTVSLDFAAGGDAAPHRENAPSPAMLATVAATAAEAIQPPAARLPPALTGGLDIRL